MVKILIIKIEVWPNKKLAFLDEITNKEVIILCLKALTEVLCNTFLQQLHL